MAQRTPHQAQVMATPWPGVHSTCITSARHFGRHSHDLLGVGFIEHGAQTSASGRGTVRAYAGELISHNPGEVHDGRPLDGTPRRWRMLHFEPQFLTRWLTPDPASPGHQTPPGGTAELRQPVIADAALLLQFQTLLTRIEQWTRRPTASSRMACDEALAHALHNLAAGYGTLALHADSDKHTATDQASSATNTIRAARERLADELLQPPSLATLAAQCGLSRYQFLRRFKAAYGLPPHAWLLQRRVEHARHLLRQGAAVADTAGDCGFADQSHLHRHFVRQLGYTPGAWQQAMAVP